MKNSVFAVLLLLRPLSAFAFEEAPPLDFLLAQLAAHTTANRASLPSFICEETATSLHRVDSKLKSKAVTVSRFSATGARSADEHREVVTINGKPAPSGADLRGPIVVKGGHSAALEGTFAQQNQQYYDFRPEPSETLEGRAAFVISFATKPGHRGLREGGVQKIPEAGTGRAWIDPANLEVLRLERTILLEFPKFGENMTAVIDWQPVSFGEKSFRVPSKVFAWIRGKDRKHDGRLEFTAEYRNYRKFEVSSGVTFEP